MFKLASDLISFLSNTWPIIVITLIAVISIRITYLLKNKQKFRLSSEILNLVFVIYLLILFQIVTCQDVISFDNNFLPFKELTRYSIGSNLFFKNIIGNILLFTPYGFFVSSYLKLDKKRIVFILVFIMSLSIELVQLVIGRCFDVDDIFLNLIGGMIGYFIYLILKKISSKLASQTIKTIIFTSLIILIIILFYIIM